MQTIIEGVGTRLGSFYKQCYVFRALNLFSPSLAKHTEPKVFKAFLKLYLNIVAKDRRMEEKKIVLDLKECTVHFL